MGQRNAKTPGDVLARARAGGCDSPPRGRVFAAARARTAARRVCFRRASRWLELTFGVIDSFGTLHHGALRTREPTCVRGARARAAGPRDAVQSTCPARCCRGRSRTRSRRLCTATTAHAARERRCVLHHRGALCRWVGARAPDLAAQRQPAQEYVETAETLTAIPSRRARYSAHGDTPSGRFVQHPPAKRATYHVGRQEGEALEDL